jgi:hypothetical protein
MRQAAAEAEEARRAKEAKSLSMELSDLHRKLQEESAELACLRGEGQVARLRLEMAERDLNDRGERGAASSDAASYFILCLSASERKPHLGGGVYSKRVRTCVLMRMCRSMYICVWVCS